MVSEDADPAAQRVKGQRGGGGRVSPGVPRLAAAALLHGDMCVHLATVG